MTNELSFKNTTEEVDLDVHRWSRSFVGDLLHGGVAKGRIQV